MQEKYRVVVTDDFRISRTFFEMMVQSDLKYALAASFSNAQDAVQYCLQNPVDLLILDVMMRTGIDGITAARQIKEQCPEIKIILATSTAETAWEEQAREIGVESFWYKEYSDESLVEVMDRTLEGDKVYPKKPVDIEIGNIKRVALTERDLDVLRELTLGYTNDEIAERLHISVNTVRTHVQNMLNKTGFKNRLELVVNAASLGIVDIQARMKDFGSRTSSLAMEEELLRARISVHDEMGHLLLSGKHYLDRPDTVDRDKLLQLERYTHLLLMHEGELPEDTERDAVDDALTAARAMGVNVSVSGDVPDDGLQRRLIGQAIRECAANTVKHACGDSLRVALTPDGEGLRAVVTGSGTPPGEPIKESGGLLNLRRSVEAAGGTMDVDIAPQFTLTVVLPG